MKIPQFSIILPVLNGEQTLPVTLENLLSADFENYEVIVSDNLSSDGTSKILESFTSAKLKVFSPVKRLGWSENLAFAYSKAKGQWQFHIGDDDVILPSKLKIIAKLIELNPQADSFLCRSFRYHWPDYPEERLANKIDASSFSGKYGELSVKRKLAYIRGRYVTAGQDFVISKKIIDKCITKYGFYVSKQHGESFSGRAALFNSDKIILVDLPMGVMGRHQKSIATQHLQPKSHYLEKGETDIAHSDPDIFELTPWKYKGYVSWSLDGLLLLSKVDKDFSELSDKEWQTWMYITKMDLEHLKKIGQIKISNIDLFFEESIKNNKRLKNINLSMNPKDQDSFLMKNILWPPVENKSFISINPDLTSVPNTNVEKWDVFDIAKLSMILETKMPIHYKWKNNPLYLKPFEEDSFVFSKLKELDSFCYDKKNYLKVSENIENEEKNDLFYKKYNEFDKLLDNLHFSEGNVCNPPFKLDFENIENKYEFEKIKNNISQYPVKSSLLKKLLNLKDFHSDKEAIVIGNGPSQNMLDKYFLQKFKLQGNHIYRMNHFTDNFDLDHYVTHYVCADYLHFNTSLKGKRAINRNKIFDFLEKKGIPTFLPVVVETNKTFKENQFLPKCELIYFENQYDKNGGWEPIFQRRYWSNTLLFTLAITRFIGYKKVYVIGHDTSYPQCIRVAPDNKLAIVESHANFEDRLLQGYPLSSNMHKYMGILSFWFWSYHYVCDSRFISLDPLSLVDGIQKIDSSNVEGWDLLSQDAQKKVLSIINKYNEIKSSL